VQDQLVAHFSHLAGAIAGGRVLREEGLLVVDSGLDCDTFNAVVSGALPERGAQARIAAAIGLFGGRAFSWWHGPDAPAHLPPRLAAAGLRLAEEERAMRLALDRPTPLREQPAGMTIERVATSEALDAYAEVIAETWTPPDPNVREFYRRAAGPALAPGPLMLFLGRLDGTPVGTAELALGADGVAGLYGVATRSAWRRGGVGSAMTLAAIDAARSCGMHRLELQASEAGEGVYGRLGFQPFGRWAEFKR
jgi:GNAT superfamily N-acetyltransferase